MSELLRTLRNAPDNTVIYSNRAWASARKGVGAPVWFPDRGAHRDTSLTAQALVEWTDDWIVVHAPEPEVHLPTQLGSVITWSNNYQVALRTGPNAWMLTRRVSGGPSYASDADILALVGKQKVYVASFTEIKPS